MKHCPASVAWYHSDLDIGFNDPQIGLCLLMYEEYPADTQYIETPAKSMIGSSLLSHVFEQSWVVTARVYPLFPWLLKACSLDMCRLILGLWIFALLLARADIQDSYDSYWQSEAHKMKFECSNHRKSMPPPPPLLALAPHPIVFDWLLYRLRKGDHWFTDYISKSLARSTNS